MTPMAVFVWCFVAFVAAMVFCLIAAMVGYTAIEIWDSIRVRRKK